MGSIERHGLRVGSMCSDPTALLNLVLATWLKMRFRCWCYRLNIQREWMLGGGDSAYSMTLQNQLIETSQLPHLWLWTFEGGCFMLLVELPDLWLKDTLFVGSPTCLCSFLTPKKCSLPLASRAVTLNAHFRVCFRVFQAKSGSAIPACFHQGCEPMSRSSQLAYFLVICLIIRQYVWYCVFSKLTNWAL